jgi:hypothetical protein
MFFPDTTVAGGELSIESVKRPRSRDTIRGRFQKILITGNTVDHGGSRKRFINSNDETPETIFKAYRVEIH